MQFNTFQEAYIYWLRTVFEDPEFRNAPRGFPSREKLGVSFGLRDPVQRHVPLASRRTNLIFNFAEALWYLSRTNDLEHIAYYAPGIRKFSANGHTLTGTAYGPRIFHNGADRIDQWKRVQKILQDDPDSKRAVIQIFECGELDITDNIDVACTLALQFFIRDGSLHGVSFMRANDAFRGIVSDVFSFTLLLELMARELGLDVGTYTHHVGSLHVYESDSAWARQVLADFSGHSSQPSLRFPEMPAGDNWPHVTEVLNIERQLRTGSLVLSAAQVEALDLPHYWQQIVALFEIYRQLRNGNRIDLNFLGMLDPVYRQATLTRWPDVFARASDNVRQDAIPTR